MDYENLGRVVREHRLRLGISQELFAFRNGLSGSTIASIERGKPHNHAFRTIRGVETGLGWAAGSFESLLMGGEPVILGTDAQGLPLCPTYRMWALEMPDRGVSVRLRNLSY